MMKKALFVLISLWFCQLYSQPANKPAKIRHNALEFSADGIATYKGKPYSGTSYTYWDNNKVNEVFTWNEGQKDGVYREYTKGGVLVTEITYSKGIKEGPYQYFYENGPKQSEGNFSNGELHGLITGYYASGIKKYEVNYSMGIRQGLSKSWFKNGAPEQVANYLDNLPNGEVYEYYADSVLYSQCNYKMGIKNGACYQFHRKSGCPAIESYYKNGNLDSVKRIWSELNCMLISEENYRNGKKNGTCIQFDANGDTLTLQTFADDILDGHFEQWDVKKVQEKVRSKKTGLDVNLFTLEKGVNIIGQYSNGKPDGFWQYGILTHYQHREGNYTDGIMTGEWKFFDINGKLLMVQWYNEEGEIVKEKHYKRPRKNKS